VTSERLPIIDLDLSDVESGMALSSEAGWNQTADDWRHFITNGQAIGVRAPGGRLVGSAAALPYDGPFGFIGMVLVTPQWRRRGIATQLVDQCIKVLCEKGLTPVLDATADGEAVYRKQGFVPQFRFDRWERPALTSPDKTAPADASSVCAMATLVDLDHQAFGADRSRLMTDFLDRKATKALCAQDNSGFALVRDGRRAAQAGPVVASSQHQALQLLERLVAGVHGALFIDVPSTWQDIGQWLGKGGFAIQRSFARMALDRARPFGNPQHLFAVAGPEFG
tara:strand:- start:7977 stop:8819 length:843 start_codon:yes stop_codon:yes gene_type:complete